MNAPDFVLSQFQTVNNQFVATQKDLNDRQLNWQPRYGTNSIGFILWHTLRIWDSYRRFTVGAADLYENEDWAKRFGFNIKGKGTGGRGVGTGFDAEDLKLVVMQSAPLIEYLRALMERTGSDLSVATGESFASEVKVPWWPQTTTVERVYMYVVTHSLMHIGEAQYVRGLVLKK